MAGQKGEGEGEGEKHERGEREGSACYKSRCFCNPPIIFSTNPIMSLSIRDQSQVSLSFRRGSRVEGRGFHVEGRGYHVEGNFFFQFFL